MENIISGFIIGVGVSLLAYFIFNGDPKTQYVYEKVYIENLEQQLEKEKIRNEIYKILLECEN